jgi:AP-2 complex subunit beta-1
VKLFIYKSTVSEVKELVHKVLKSATEEVDNPDLRDRGFMYWRLLAVNPAVAGEIVLAEKPPITTDSDRMDRGALDQLLLHTGTLGSIYHKNPETFIRGASAKGLADSPALNGHSRQVLVSAQRERPALGPIVVAGPGPVEPSAGPEELDVGKPPPPLPLEVQADGGAVDVLGEDDDNVQGDNSDVDEELAASKSRPAASTVEDPYSNLDGAFGSYLQGSAPQRAVRQAEDDVLF